MSWVRIWVHLVFSTKNRKPLLCTEALRSSVFEHIRQNAIQKGIRIDCINGYKEHVHCLISLGKEQSISKIVRLLKGEASFWINKNRLITDRFSWQDDYWAVSVSESHWMPVRDYIRSQEMHHRSRSFSEEVDEFMEKYGWELIKEE